MLKKEKVVKVNLGSGPSGIDGWINYDWGVLPLLSRFVKIRSLLIKFGFLSAWYDVSWPKIKLVDIRKKIPLKNNSVDYIYCSHVLEHFERWQALKVLKESYRVLKKGGVIRIAVPDIAKMVFLYENDSSFGGKEFCRLWWGFEKDVRPKGLWGWLARKFIRGHQWNYDVKEMSRLIKEAGFSKIKRRSFRKGRLPDLDRIEIEVHKKASMYIEAEK